MKIGAIIGLSVLGVATLATVGYFGFVRPKKNDEFTIEVNTVNWANKKVPYKIKRNSPFASYDVTSGTTSWRSDLVGKGKVNGVKNKNEEFGEVHLPGGLIIYANYKGKDMTAKIIDFNGKTIKDFKGNISNAIAGASQTITNLFG